MSAQGKKKRQFLQSENLRKALGRDGVSMPGATANYLLGEFLHNGGRLRKESAHSSKLCQDKKFDDWRSTLKEKGWITYLLNPSGKWMDYYPTKKLSKYINAEKSLHEIATRAELDDVTHNLQTQLEAVKDKVSLLERTVEHLIKTFDPPYTEEKAEKHLKIARSQLPS